MNQKGFVNIILIVIAAAVIAIGGYVILTRKTTSPAIPQPTPSSNSQPLITLLSPNGGEQWTKGEKVKISWISSKDIKFVNIRLNILGDPNSQSFSASIASNISNGGSYDWVVQNLYAEVLGVTDLPDSDEYSITIEDSEHNNIYDSSNAPFKIISSTEKASGIIKSVYSKSGKNYIDIDYIELNPNWAPGGMSGPAYQNNNPKIRTFEISPSAKFFEGGRYITFSEFQKFFIASDFPAYQTYNPWDIVVADGVLVEIIEHYLP